MDIFLAHWHLSNEVNKLLVRWKIVPKAIDADDKELVSVIDIDILEARFGCNADLVGQKITDWSSGLHSGVDSASQEHTMDRVICLSDLPFLTEDSKFFTL